MMRLFFATDVLALREDIPEPLRDDPARWGDKPKKGKGTPMPQSHYTDLRKPGSKVGQDVRGARYLCTQCHGPQAEVDPLVANRFSPDSGK